MCKLDGTKCDTCLEITVQTDSGVILNFNYDERDVDNDTFTTWLFSTGCVDGIEVRSVGGTVWSTMTKEEWEIGQA